VREMLATIASSIRLQSIVAGSAPTHTAVFAAIDDNQEFKSLAPLREE